MAFFHLRLLFGETQVTVASAHEELKAILGRLEGKSGQDGVLLASTQAFHAVMQVRVSCSLSRLWDLWAGQDLVDAFAKEAQLRSDCGSFAQAKPVTDSNNSCWKNVRLMRLGFTLVAAELVASIKWPVISWFVFLAIATYCKFFRPRLARELLVHKFSFVCCGFALSQSQGGDLGFFGPSEMQKEFDEIQHSSLSLPLQWCPIVW